jgi:hypothetical protein
MVDRLLPSFDGMLPISAGEAETEQQAQTRISSLPNIRGVLHQREGDLTERVDGFGRVYRWEAFREGVGLWVYAGFLRPGRQRLAQPIDPGDIRWLDMKAYRTRMTIAARRIKAVPGAQAPNNRHPGVARTAVEDIILPPKRPPPARDSTADDI